MNYDNGYTLTLDPSVGEDFSERESDPDYEWGWLVITELVTDGRDQWFETQRYLYYSPSEARAIFRERCAEKSWMLVD